MLTAKEKAKDARLRKHFGITLAIYKIIFEFQKGCCGICERPRADFKNDFAVDHNHKTGEIRGLLCMLCNRALGKFRDNDYQVMQAGRYVQSPPAALALGGQVFTVVGRIGTKVREKLLAKGIKSKQEASGRKAKRRK